MAELPVGSNPDEDSYLGARVRAHFWYKSTATVHLTTVTVLSSYLSQSSNSNIIKTDRNMNEFLVMKSVIVLLLVAVCHGEVEFQAHRRAGTNLGLIPFPRVGRTDPSLLNAYADVHEVKRQGLMPFPRVGRNELRSQFANQANLPAWILPENLIEYQKRNGGSNMNAGMWFGPRLGRLQKRSFDYNDTPWALVALKDPSGSLRQTDFAPRLSRESEEDNDDTVVEEVLSSRRLDTKNRNNISQQ